MPLKTLNLKERQMERERVREKSQIRTRTRYADDFLLSVEEALLVGCGIKGRSQRPGAAGLDRIGPELMRQSGGAV